MGMSCEIATAGNAGTPTAEWQTRAGAFADGFSGTHIDDITGDWSGQIDIFGQRVLFVFRVSADADDLNAQFDCPQAQLHALAVRRTSFCRHVVRFELGDFDAGFSGVLDADRQEIVGAFEQGAYQFPAVLSRRAG